MFKFIKIILVILFTCSCQTSKQQTLSWESIYKEIDLKFPNTKNINSKQLAKLTTESNVHIFDTRSKKEYDLSHIANSKLLSPEDKNNIKELCYKNKCVFYCSVGYRSSKYINDLDLTKHSFNLKGGIFMWKNNSMPLTPISKVHPYNKHWGQLLE